MKIENKKSGDKHTLKITPEHIREIPILMRIFKRPPDPERGSRNPVHWHVKIKEKE